MKYRNQKYQQGKRGEVKSLDKRIKKDGRSDRKGQVVNQFQVDPNDPHRKKVEDSELS